MTKRKVIFNEAQEVVRVINGGFSGGKFNYQEAYLVAKHYCWNLGHRYRKIERELILFCQQHDPNFNPVKKRGVIRNIVRQSLKHKLREIKTVYITQKELETIRNVKNFSWQKILFVLLVLAKELKFSNQEMNVENKNPVLFGYFVSHKYIAEVRRLSKLRMSVKTIEYLLHDFYLLGLVDHTYADQIRVKYGDDSSLPALAIYKDDFDNLIDRYVEYCGGELLYCEKCGKEFLKMARQKLLCQDCYGEKRRQQFRDSKRKNKDVKNSTTN